MIAKCSYKPLFLFILTFVISIRGLGQAYETCIVTDLEHWGLPNQVYNGIPDYFTRDSTMVNSIKREISFLLKQKFRVKEVNFLNQGINVRDDVEPQSNTYHLDSVDRTLADLFVLVSSYVSSQQVMSIEVEIEDKTEKRIHKRKSKTLLQPISNPSGIETNVDIGKEDFKSLYIELLNTAFLESKKKQNLGTKEVKRVKTRAYDHFLAKAIQCDISTPALPNQYQVSFHGTTENTEITIRGKNERSSSSDGLNGKKLKKRGTKLMHCTSCPENWTINYEQDLKKGSIFWKTTHFEAEIMSSDGSLIGEINRYDKDHFSIQLGDDIISLKEVYFGSIYEISKNQKLSAVVQSPKNNLDTNTKFFYLKTLNHHSTTDLLLSFLLKKILDQL